MKSNTIKIIKDVEVGYDRISDKFSSTRNFFWKDLEFIKKYVKDNDKILDFGCGNGRLLEILKDKRIDYRGIDISQGLITLAKEKYPKFKNSFSKIEAEQSLPFIKNFFNQVFSIAVFHHFPPEYQKERMRELYNLLKPGGRIILTVWNLNKNNLEIKKWKKISEKEVEINFQNNEGKIFSRYHYIFSGGDLKKLLKETGFKVERCDIINEKNILIIAKK